MRILVFNWKDIKNPDAGGAEVFTHEIAKRWVAAGDEVTLFCRSFAGAAPNEMNEGVKIIRKGGRLSVYKEARRWYRRFVDRRFDVVIDEINTRPFMAPGFVRDTPVIALIHQLAAEVWTEETHFPIGLIGRHLLEARWLRRYQGIPTITVSRSTESDLRRLGFRNPIVVPQGLSVRPLRDLPEKEDVPTLIFVGRLVRTKRPDHAIAAHQILEGALPDVRLWVVGDGYLQPRLKRKAGQNVRFFGRIGELEKQELLKRAHVLLVPGVREGWGLVVTEANALGTPAVAYRVPGLVDSVEHERTGLLVDPDPKSLADGARRLILDARLYASLQSGAHARAGQHSWDHTASEIRRRLGDATRTLVNSTKPRPNRG